MVASGDPGASSAVAAPAAAGDPVQAQLRQARDRFVAFAFCWADMLVELDRHGRVVFAAGAVSEIVGRPVETVIGRTLAELALPEDAPLVGQILAAAARGRRVDDLTVRLIRHLPDTQPGGMARQGGGQAPVAHARVSLVGYALAELAGHVFLTLRYRPRGLPAEPRAGGRQQRLAGFSRTASRAITAAAGASEQRPRLSLVSASSADGLPSGSDEVRRAVETCLKARALGPDGAIDMGDGRFGILHEPELDLAAVDAEIARVTRSLVGEGGRLVIDHAELPIDDGVVADEGDLARGLMFVMNEFSRAPERERDLPGLAANLSTLLDDAVDEVARFKDIIARSAFEMALHPIISLSDAAIHHYEALCRFRPADGEDGSPGHRIRFAENAGLIHEVDLAMASKALAWVEARLAAGEDVALAVNVSGLSIGVPEFVSGLERMLDERPWSRGRLLFELTESAQISDLTLASSFMQDLRARGYRISLDDFGSGAASFEFLSRLDIDAVKIDGSAIKSARHAKKGMAFLSALTELCRKLRIAGIAERIDDRDTLDFARRCGFDFVQGYLFGRPAIDPDDLQSPDEIARMIRR